MRIKEKFQDGDICTVTLKDPFKHNQFGEDEQLWYDRAFGSQRNIMKIELSFTPPEDKVAPGQFLFLVKLDYQMFPEMAEDEFRDANFPPSELIPMEVEKLSSHTEYLLELERPYGSYQVTIMFKPINKDGQMRDGEPND